MSEGPTEGVAPSTSESPAEESEDQTQRLIGWSTIAALVGLVLSIGTLSFTVWFSHVLKGQAEVLAPAAKMASNMDSDISRSIAALRGWLAYGAPRFVNERQGTWRRVERVYDEFVTLVRPQVPEANRRGFDTLRVALSDLKYAQWAIEDVAHTPGNEPAVHEYESHLLPIRRSIFLAFNRAADPLRSGSRNDPDTLFQLTAFYEVFTGADSALQQYSRNPSAATGQDYERRAAGLRELVVSLERIPDDEEFRLGSTMRPLLRFVISEARAYDLRAQLLLAKAEQHEESTAEVLFRYRAQPLADFVSQRMRFISDMQARASQESASLFRKLSLVIVALALLIGIMSVSTLYVSVRVRSRVTRVLERARKLGRYTIERKIGEGGIGEVYLARHAMLRRPAAIKLLREEGRASARARKQFRSEVQLTSRLTHPNTIHIFDYGVTPDGVFYYAMEYLDGATLQQVVDATGAMPSDRVVHVLRQVAGSLQEAHGLGLLHRDIKPSNIMLCKLGAMADTAKVLDFGLVAEIDAGGGKTSGDNHLVGTPLYLAPETILEAEGNSERSDLYALGAVGYYLLCGSPPFESDDVLDVLCQHLNELPTPPSKRVTHHIDPALELLILQCLEKDPDRRPASARELRERLEVLAAADAWTQSERDAWWVQYGEIVAASVATGSSSTVKSAMNVNVRSRGVSTSTT